MTPGALLKPMMFLIGECGLVDEVQLCLRRGLMRMQLDQFRNELSQKGYLTRTEQA